MSWLVYTFSVGNANTRFAASLAGHFIYIQERLIILQRMSSREIAALGTLQYLCNGPSPPTFITQTTITENIQAKHDNTVCQCW